ncbi:acyl-CoA N-acyltransferase [Dunaliella salina]|uniref:N-alpha-acetyltransferase 40 n=1 Tax=Dunaliella salina TaxID=3046 RepID=A0ABQ7H5Y9_DUNSA|nr:acyl-CoA N-acyltransferase [Dunaliella salina]|eukprot:KAF5842263.1 acyl-CoA N-acyltransferase [Dunaliella salina]
MCGDRCLHLVKSTLHHLYLPVWGWSDSDKKKQLEAATSRFVIAFAPNSSLPEKQPHAGSDCSEAPPFIARPLLEDGQVPVAMVNYRFEAGYTGEPALYLYELVVDPAYQRLGLASHLVRLTEAMAWSSAMDAIILTEFVDNKAAAALYRRLGFTLDKASPRGKGYEILSKHRPKGKGSDKKS